MRPKRPSPRVFTIRACFKDKPGKPGAFGILDPDSNRRLVVDAALREWHINNMVSLNRVIMQPASRRMIRKLGPQGLDVAEISGKWGAQFKFKSYRRFRYPAHDICAGSFVEEGAPLSFDLILANQVWEHLDRPYAAARHVHAMLRPGGHFWLAVPFYIPYHPAPQDCSRWSARGLTNLLIEAGFEAERIQAEQWGNAHVAQRNLEEDWPPQHDPEVDDLSNDPNMPICAWALAKKR